MIDDSKLKWQEKGRRKLLETPVFNVMETDSISPDGNKGNYIVMEARDWVTVIPVLGNDFIMVKQWRHGEQDISIEFPGGVVDEGENPIEGAARELLEETGFKAGKLTHLATVNPNPALFSNHVHFYAAEELEDTGTMELDNDEYLDFMKISKSEVYEKMGSREYPHALMAAALGIFRQYESKK